MRKGSAGEYHWEKISGRWQFIDGRWYYLNPVSDGTRGIMCARKRTPDGWLVKEATPIGSMGGRPSERYLIHPVLLRGGA